jgi:hypothetical protein
LENQTSIIILKNQRSNYSAFDQSFILLAPPSTNLFKVASTSRSAGALNEQDLSPVSQLTSVMPSTVAKAFFTEDAQPPQVMPGSLSDTCCVPSVFAVAEAPSVFSPVSGASVEAAPPPVAVESGVFVSAALSQPRETARIAVAINVSSKRISKNLLESDNIFGRRNLPKRSQGGIEVVSTFENEQCVKELPQTANTYNRILFV